MSYCSVHGAEDIPGCVECGETPAEIRAREDIERDERENGKPAKAAKAPAKEEEPARAPKAR